VIGSYRAGLLLAAISIVMIGCDSTLPRDVTELGVVRPAAASESDGTITQAAALRAASDAGYDFANRSAYLVVMTPTGLAAGAPPINDRLVWLVRATDIEVRGPPPTGGPEPAPFHFSYVLVDALTGEVLMATYRV